jgi:hypothetical protein
MNGMGGTVDSSFVSLGVIVSAVLGGRQERVDPNLALLKDASFSARNDWRYDPQGKQ